MMSFLNDNFDKVVCINLLERQDKRIAMQERFDKYNIDVEWFTAVQYGFIPNIVKPINKANVGKFNETQPYEIGAALSHYTVIKKALLEDRETLFVFEDDAKLHQKFNDRLEDYWETLPQNWDIVLLYSFMYEFLPQNVRISARWMRSYRSWSLMAYGMKKRAMKEYIRLQDKFFTISDTVTYYMQENDSFNIFSAVPALCIPETKLGSNIRGSNMNYQAKPTITNLGYNDERYE